MLCCVWLQSQGKLCDGALVLAAAALLFADPWTGRRPMQCCTRRVGPNIQLLETRFLSIFLADFFTLRRLLDRATSSCMSPRHNAFLRVIRKFRKLAKEIYTFARSRAPLQCARRPSDLSVLAWPSAFATSVGAPSSDLNSAQSIFWTRQARDRA